MSYVYTSSIVVPSARRDKRQSAGGGSFAFGGTETTIVNNNTTVTAAPKLALGFIGDASPSILDYNLMYSSTFGDYPDVRIWIWDGVSGHDELSIKPKFIMVGGLLDSIVYDLGTPQTGFIILS